MLNIKGRFHVKCSAQTSFILKLFSIGKSKELCLRWKKIPLLNISPSNESIAEGVLFLYTVKYRSAVQMRENLHTLFYLGADLSPSMQVSMGLITAVLQDTIHNLSHFTHFGHLIWGTPLNTDWLKDRVRVCSFAWHREIIIVSNKGDAKWTTKHSENTHSIHDSFFIRSASANSSSYFAFSGDRLLKGWTFCSLAKLLTVPRTMYSPESSNCFTTCIAR